MPKTISEDELRQLECKIEKFPDGAAMRQLVGEPDPFRLKYRLEIKEIISNIVGSKIDRGSASRAIKKFVEEKIPSEDQEQFRQVTEIELIGLHEGNFARYQVRPIEFYAWKAIWEAN